MNCSLAQELLQRSLDDSILDESPQWSAHLRECADCASLAEAARFLQEGLRLLPASTPPLDLEARIVKKVLRERRRRARLRWGVGFALAAGMLLAIAMRFEGRRISPQPVSPAQETAEKTPSNPKEDATPTLRDSAAELGEVFASLTSQTATETVEQTRLWAAILPSPELPKVELNSARTRPPTRPLREASQGVSEGLEPVTTSARRAVDLFLRELPPMESEPKGF
jgi:hypothetical protein